MRDSPRRPIILKRRKLPFQKSESDAGCDEADGPRCKAKPTPSTARCFPDGIRIMDHPTMPDTQVVVIPKAADLQSVISALTTKGKECGPQGRNKFILLSGSTSLDEEGKTLGHVSTETRADSGKGGLTLTGTQGGVTSEGTMEAKSTLKTLKKETQCCPLDDSLTNIQWLGKMSSDGLGSEPDQKCPSKNNPSSCHQLQQLPRIPEEVKDPQSERPPYSYMAMIQFAINSKKNRQMTLKEIYNWIEDHFPYFRNVAKPGWKNSIRHNLSLHDMFVRETSPDGKISYWTIRPEANRCLTLDQVYKPLADPVTCVQTTQVVFQQQQKKVTAEPKKVMPAHGTERKMKPLLPRTDSYLVPIQLPLTPSLFLPTSSPVSLATPPQPLSSSTPSSGGGGKRVRIAPKVSQNDMNSVMLCTPATQELKEEPVCVPVTPEVSVAPPPKTRQRENSSSRRKQRLVLPATEEPVLLYPDSTLFDSGVVSDVSAFQDTREAEPDPEPQPIPKLEPDSPYREYTFKTPIKSSHPSSSTPSKLPAALEPWRITPVGKGGVLDFSPIRTPSGPQLTPQRHEHTPFSFNGTPFKELPLFNSPRELLTNARPSPRRSTPTCSRELQVGAANRSLTEGLVLDTLNDSLSKILVDISFSGLEDDDLGMGNISWSQFIPDLK
ncbi:forkhead box protein M1 isoform X1 [Myxocyprinus asiaticus]|uniref:forkhead box protein M1 isoform X1 n=1 Tax=Myxocyprinus asiaticus TaxID=70543 RepID=UPI00222209E5|nr:forkhead box protein M1 isoform X1 [Myxocyprinus asiaticus]XP_051544176.1 forkhead box protein M1 isoform X1 [Myxocyprinus asiaticus]